MRQIIYYLNYFQNFCTSILETISHHINTQNNDFAAHPLLSIFKMAEVQIIWSDNNSSIKFKLNKIFTIIILIPIIRWISWLSFVDVT